VLRRKEVEFRIKKDDIEAVYSFPGYSRLSNTNQIGYAINAYRYISKILGRKDEPCPEAAGLMFNLLESVGYRHEYIEIKEGLFVARDGSFHEIIPAGSIYMKRSVVRKCSAHAIAISMAYLKSCC
jgi:hypothetical protein